MSRIHCIRAVIGAVAPLQAPGMDATARIAADPAPTTAGEGA